MPEQMGESLEISNISEEIRGVMTHGRLKMQSNCIYYKNNKTGKLEQIPFNDIENFSWIRMASGIGLRIKLHSGLFFRFCGFSIQDVEKINLYVKQNLDIDIHETKYSVKGHNWGNPNFDGSMLSLELPSSKHENEKTKFLEIPLNNVSHCTTGKNEVTLEFQQDDDASVSLMELRFYVPPSEFDNDPVKTFHEKVMDKANVIQAVGDAIAIFHEAQCLTPRGRYDIKLYPTFAQLHGKTFDYKIPYTTILRLFVLPHKDHRQIYFVISLDPPIKQGQTRYPFLILLFEKDDEISLNLSLSVEELQSKYEGKLSKEMTGKTFEVFSRLFKALSGNKITVPGNFVSHNGTSSCINCSYRAAAGYLYPLERCFVFVHKPPLAIRFDEVASVNFARSSGTTTKTFDFEVSTKSGVDHTFSSIPKEEYSNLFDFIKTKNLIVKNVGGKLSRTEGAGEEVADDFYDENDEMDGQDHYLNRVKAEARERDADVDDDDEEDEDFAPDQALVAKDNDLDEEYDSDAKSSSGSSGDASSTGKPDRDDVDNEDRSGSDGSEKERKKKKSVLMESKKPAVKPFTTIKPTTKPSSKSSNKEGKRSKKGATKDPNAPKRPLTAYFIWLQDNRERLKTENPKASIIDITKIGGEEWRNLSDKSRWEKKAIKAKEEYEIAMNDYKKQGGGDSVGISSSPSHKTTISVPKASSKKSDESSDLSSLDD